MSASVMTSATVAMKWRPYLGAGRFLSLSRLVPSRGQLCLVLLAELFLDSRLLRDLRKVLQGRLIDGGGLTLSRFAHPGVLVVPLRSHGFDSVVLGLQNLQGFVRMLPPAVLHGPDHLGLVVDRELTPSRPLLSRSGLDDRTLFTLNREQRIVDLVDRSLAVRTVLGPVQHLRKLVLLRGPVGLALPVHQLFAERRLRADLCPVVHQITTRHHSPLR